MKKLICSIVLTWLLLPDDGYAQQHENWEILSKVTFQDQLQNPAVYGMPKPIFMPEVKALEGKTITLDGFIFPMEGKTEAKNFILSSLPIANCFFCGNGGPETVVEIFAEDPVRYTEKKIKVRGKLLLSDANPNGLPYSLSEAVLVKE